MGGLEQTSIVFVFRVSIIKYFNCLAYVGLLFNAQICLAIDVWHATLPLFLKRDKGAGFNSLLNRVKTCDEVFMPWAGIAKGLYGLNMFV